MQGVFATDDARAPRDVRGHTLPVRFEIVDKRPLPPAQGAVHGDTAQAQRRGPYSVAVSLQVRRRCTQSSGCASWAAAVIRFTKLRNDPAAC